MKEIIEKLVNLEAMILSLKEMIVDTPEKTAVFRKLYQENGIKLVQTEQLNALDNLETKSQPPV